MQTKNKIAVIAHKGMVGSTVFKYYEEKGYDVRGWSRSSHTHEFKDILDSDYIFVCIPTPFDWENGLSDTQGLYDFLQKINGETKAIVVIKSTVEPGTTEAIQLLFSKLILAFNPEFLSESSAYEDFVNPDRQILGTTKKSYPFATELLHLLPNSPCDMIMTSTEAEIVKYVNNFHGSLMIIFANFIYDIASFFGSDFEKIKQASQASKWVGSPMGRMYWDVYHGGFRGYGGKCFPKDMHSLAEFAEATGIYSELLDATIAANQRILKEQGLTEEGVEKISSRK